MAQHVVGFFDSRPDAEAAVRELQSIGISNADISFVGSNVNGEYDDTSSAIGAASGADGTEASEGASAGALGGGIVGGLAGVLVGLGLLTIPGIGPVLAAGPLTAAIGTAGAAVGAGAVGAAAGAAAGGLLGALVGAGIPQEDASVYAEGVRRGGTLVVARVSGDQAAMAVDVLDRNNAVDIEERREQYRSGGWTRNDEMAGPYDVSTTGDGGAREHSLADTSATPATRRRARPYPP